MAITRTDVLHVARLARLELAPDELPKLEADLRRIVEYVSELAQVDTEGIPPTAHVTVAHAPLRADVPRPGLSHEAALAEAPRCSDGAFAVPTFVDES
jgi:aspartyl-tRNA(Asn)/glutamyl-tRNA(Gln) amidotransferase subunit C